MNRLYGSVVSVAVLCAVLYPLCLDPEADDFPLSTYPMFARPRAATTTVISAVAVAASGEHVPIPPALLGTGETMQAVRILSRSLRDGPQATQQLCAAIASRVSGHSNDVFRAAEQVAIVSQEIDVLRYASGERALGNATTHETCPVTRGAQP